MESILIQYALIPLIITETQKSSFWPQDGRKKIHGRWWCFHNTIHLYRMGEEGSEPQKKERLMEMNSQDPLPTQVHKSSNETKMMY